MCTGVDATVTGISGQKVILFSMCLFPFQTLKKDKLLSILTHCQLDSHCEILQSAVQLLLIRHSTCKMHAYKSDDIKMLLLLSKFCHPLCFSILDFG